MYLTKRKQENSDEYLYKESACENFHEKIDDDKQNNYNNIIENSTN